MITAVDTSVLLDVLLQDPSFAASSEAALRGASQKGALIICEVVYAELAGVFPTQPALETFLRESGLQLRPSEPATLWTAGDLWRRFCLQRPRHPMTARRILADFLIGAHASLHGDSLLTRDKGFYRATFSTLRLAER